MRSNAGDRRRSWIRLASAGVAALYGLGYLCTPMLGRLNPGLVAAMWIAGFALWMVLAVRLERAAERRGLDDHWLTFKVAPWWVLLPVAIWSLLAELDLASDTGVFGRHVGTVSLFGTDWGLLGLTIFVLFVVLTYNAVRLTLLDRFPPPRR